MTNFIKKQIKEEENGKSLMVLINSSIPTPEMDVYNFQKEHISSKLLLQYMTDFSNLEESFNKLDALFDQSELNCNDFIVDCYPFNQSFDEFCGSVSNWVNYSIFNIYCNYAFTYTILSSYDELYDDRIMKLKENVNIISIVENALNDIFLKFSGISLFTDYDMIINNQKNKKYTEYEMKLFEFGKNLVKKIFDNISNNDFIKNIKAEGIRDIEEINERQMSLFQYINKNLDNDLMYRFLLKDFTIDEYKIILSEVLKQSVLELKYMTLEKKLCDIFKINFD